MESGRRNDFESRISNLHPTQKSQSVRWKIRNPKSEIRNYGSLMLTFNREFTVGIPITADAIRGE